MSDEKSAVAIESSAAMMDKLPAFNRILMDFWFRQLQRSASSALALAACRSVPAAAAVGMRAAEAMVADMISADHIDFFYTNQRDIFFASALPTYLPTCCGPQG